MARSAVPYLCVKDAEKALEFYSKAFGAEIVGQPIAFQGKIGHAVLNIGACTVFLADEFADYGVQSPLTLGACTATVVLTVEDVDAFIERVRTAGATVAMEPKDEPYGRTARFVDPFGQRWIVNAPASAPGFLGVDHIDTRVAKLATAEPFYDRLMPKLGLSSKRYAYVDAAGEWHKPDDGGTYNAVEYYENAQASVVPRFVGFIEDAGMTPTKTRIAFRVPEREQLAPLASFLTSIGARHIEFSADMDAYPAVFFEDPAGTQLELCARRLTSTGAQ
jgi:PhnB protein